MKFKDIIAYCLVIALGIILALHFILFWIYGGVFIHESNKIILTIETVMSAAILIFGVERLISSTQKTNRSHAPIPPRIKMPQPSTTSSIFLRDWLRDNRRTAAPTATTVAVMPAQTTLMFDSDARYMENYNFRVINGTEDSSDMVVYIDDTDCEHSAHFEVSRL